MNNNLTLTQKDFTIDCTGDAVCGDTILFTEAVFTGSFKKPKHVGDRRIAARLVKDSYGENKQQHTFTIVVIWSDGVQPLEEGKKTTRKGRNIYKNRTLRLPWENEGDRRQVLEEKHNRGDMARHDRHIRRGY